MEPKNEPGASTEPSTTPDPGQATTPPAKAVVKTTEIDVANIPDEALKDRLDRAKKAGIKETGFASIEEAKAAKERLAAFEKAEADRAAAQLSEQEKLQKAIDEERAARAAAETALATEREAASILKAAHARGIANVDFATYLVEKAKKSGGDVDIEKVLSDAVGDPSTRAALGLPAEPGAPAPAPKPTTTPTVPGTAPKPPTGNGAPGKSAKDMTDDEWRAFKRAHNII